MVDRTAWRLVRLLILLIFLVLTRLLHDDRVRLASLLLPRMLIARAVRPRNLLLDVVGLAIVLHILLHLLVLLEEQVG